MWEVVVCMADELLVGNGRVGVFGGNAVVESVNKLRVVVRWDGPRQTVGVGSSVMQEEMMNMAGELFEKEWTV